MQMEYVEQICCFGNKNVHKYFVHEVLSQTGRGHRLDMVTDLTLIFKILNKKNVEGKKDGFFFWGGGPFCFCFFGGEGGFF